VIRSDLPVTPASIAYARDFRDVEQALLAIRQDSGPDDTVAVNYYRYPFIRYYTSRHIERVFDKEALLSLGHEPEYFIFIPYNNDASKQLFEALNAKYALMSQCRSQRFPALIFKRKE
jgi:hypothetical protein